MTKGTKVTSVPHESAVSDIRRHLERTDHLWKRGDFSDAILSAARAIRIASSRRGKSDLGSAGMRELRRHLESEGKKIRDARNSIEHADDRDEKEIHISHGGLFATAPGGTIDISNANVKFGPGFPEEVVRQFEQSSKRLTGKLDHDIFETWLAKALHLINQQNSA